MKYRQFIEDNFLIDEPKLGKLIPFKFNVVQVIYYDILVLLGIERLGISVPLREFILKARREGFSSLILAIFAADDILQTNPTETQVVSYKDDATDTFRKRYRRFVLSWAARKIGITIEEIQTDPNVLEKISKQVFSVDASDLELKHNRAHFYCGTASARTGGRGGVLQKLLFSEAAYYIDTEKMTARETIEGTAQQVDKESGWIFQESTGNGKGNYFYETYELIKQGLSRYTKRFFGWRSFYSPAQFEVIKSEFTDPDMLKKEYPETEEDAFLGSGLSFTTEDQLNSLIGVEADKELIYWLELPGVNYIDQCELLKSAIQTIVSANKYSWLYAGIDVAKDRDKTVLTILKDKRRFDSDGGLRVLSIDSTGAGDFMPDWFEKNTRWYLNRVKFSRQSKDVMYKNLQVILQNRLTKIPELRVGRDYTSEEAKNFWKEMLDLQKQVIGDMYVVGHPNGEKYHDDYPDSWALAEIGYVSINGLPKSMEVPHSGANIDSEVSRLLNTKNTRGDSGEGSNYQ